MNVNLVMFKSDGSRRDFVVNKDRTLLGRTNNCDLRIPLSSVSRQHCEIRLDTAGHQLTAKDLGSSNGTFLNGSRIQEAILNAGDEIQVGPVKFTVVIDGQPAQITPPKTSAVEAAKRESMAGKTGAASGAPAQPETIADNLDDHEPMTVEDEHYTPTVDLDDPIAALEQMAGGKDPSPHQALDKLPSLDDDDDLPLLAEDDEALELPMLNEDEDDPRK
ncbi:MAG: FHA domain-containing protein [Phycisphaera sp.]|nr:FHA domain-containing protein [Phycisphaera sp.]